MNVWVKMPTNWIRNKENPPLVSFRWKGIDKSAHISALMLYLIINHHVNNEPTRQFPEPGYAQLSFTELMNIAGISRAKIADGLTVLVSKGLIERIKDNKINAYKICNYNPYAGGWAKLPAKSLYDASLKRIPIFHSFHLRLKNELNALKLYFLLLAFRDDAKNSARISYDTIYMYSGIQKNDIRSAISLLINHSLVQVDKSVSANFLDRTMNIYRIVGVNRYKHGGTTSEDPYDELP